MPTRALLLVAAAVLSWASPAAAVDPKSLPDFTGYVVDQARVISPSAQKALRDLAGRLDRAGVAQLALLTVRPEALGDLDKNEFKNEVFKKWRLGHDKKRSDGLLLVLIPGGKGNRHALIETGYGLEGVLPDGKVLDLWREHGRPLLAQDRYGEAALAFFEQAAAVLEANASPGGELAPTPGVTGGKGYGITGERGAPGSRAARAEPDDGRATLGLGVAVTLMGALLIALLSSFGSRRFPGQGVGALALAAAVIPPVALVFLGGIGWLAWILGIVANVWAYVTIRGHRCPRDGGWMRLEREVVDQPTEWSTGLAVHREACTTCSYRSRREVILPRREHVVVVSGGGGSSDWGSSDSSSSSDSFSGGGGGESGGGGGSDSV